MYRFRVFFEEDTDIVDFLTVKATFVEEAIEKAIDWWIDHGIAFEFSKIEVQKMP